MYIRLLTKLFLETNFQKHFTLIKYRIIMGTNPTFGMGKLIEWTDRNNNLMA